MKTEGLFSKVTRERVSANGGRWIKIGRLELDQRRERKGWPAGTVTGAVAAMAGGRRLTVLATMALEATKLKLNGMGR